MFSDLFDKAFQFFIDPVTQNATVPGFIFGLVCGFMLGSIFCKGFYLLIRGVYFSVKTACIHRIEAKTETERRRAQKAFIDEKQRLQLHFEQVLNECYLLDRNNMLYCSECYAEGLIAPLKNDGKHVRYIHVYSGNPFRIHPLLHAYCIHCGKLYEIDLG